MTSRSDQPAHTPRSWDNEFLWLQRSRKRAGMIGAMGFLAIGAALIWMVFTPGTVVTGVPFRVFVGCVLLVHVALVLSARSMRRVRGKIQDARGLVCPDCLYDLRALGGPAHDTQPLADDEVVLCPECGAMVDLRVLPAQWEAAWRRRG